MPTENLARRPAALCVFDALAVASADFAQLNNAG
jgi:hypothetical protein